VAAQRLEAGVDGPLAAAADTIHRRLLRPIQN
jgi:hypothetical protein